MRRLQTERGGCCLETAGCDRCAGSGAVPCAVRQESKSQPACRSFFFLPLGPGAVPPTRPFQPTPGQRNFSLRWMGPSKSRVFAAGWAAHESGDCGMITIGSSGNGRLHIFRPSPLPASPAGTRWTARETLPLAPLIRQIGLSCRTRASILCILLSLRTRLKERGDCGQ